MGASWLLCCFDQRSKRWNRKGSRELDERFGDMSISGPMTGGWNQSTAVDHEHSPSSVQSSADQGSPHTSTNGSEGSTSKKWPQGLLQSGLAFRSNSRRSSFTAPTYPSAMKDQEDTASASAHDKPGFVYKPASEEFFRNMSEIGKSRHPPQSPRPSVEQQQTHNRNLSVRTASSLRPSSPADIPCHPSYQNRPLPSSPESSTTLPRQTPIKPLDCNDDHRKDACSPTVIPVTSSPSSIEEDGHHLAMDPEKMMLQQHAPKIVETTPPPLPANSKQKKQKPKSRRAVTEELVPSTKELFG